MISCISQKGPYILLRKWLNLKDIFGNNKLGNQSNLIFNLAFT